MKATLENEFLSVTVDTLGAEMHSIKKEGSEYLWQADPKFWARHAPVLFPIVGKLKNGTYRYADQTYKMGGTVLLGIMNLSLSALTISV